MEILKFIGFIVKNGNFILSKYALKSKLNLLAVIEFQVFS